MKTIRSGHICFYAQSDVTVYILRGKAGDLLIDSGFFTVWNGLSDWLNRYRVTHLFLTHAHPDHDWNAAKLQRAGVKILLSEKDRFLRQNFRTQPVQPTAPRWRLRNLTQNLGGRLVNSEPYTPDIWLSGDEAELLRALGFDAEIVPLPGHTCGSLGILSGDVLYCGDAFTALWRRPDITPHAVSITQMRDSLQRILDISPKWLACGHGLPVRMRDAAPVIRAYLRQPA